MSHSANVNNKFEGKRIPDTYHEPKPYQCSYRTHDIEWYTVCLSVPLPSSILRSINIAILTLIHVHNSLRARLLNYSVNAEAKRFVGGRVSSVTEVRR